MRNGRIRLMGRAAATAMAALMSWPQGAAALDFYENFAWKGNHEATFDNGTATSVFWNEDDWDVTTDTSYLTMLEGQFYADVQKAFPASSQGKPDKAYVVGGDGSQGVGVIHVENAEDMVGARLRNPMLISSGQPGVVEFWATWFSTSGHWWELAVSPSNGVVIGGPATSVPDAGGPGHSPNEESINVLPRGTDVQCYSGGAGSPFMMHTMINGVSGGTLDDASAPFLASSVQDMDKLHPFRVLYYPDRIEMYTDKDGDGAVDVAPFATFPVAIPWTEVYVDFLAASYETDHHPQSPCWVGNARDFQFRNIRVGPVKYGRTVCFPKNNGTSHVPQDTGWTHYDLRDVMRWGPPVNGVQQTNAVRYASNFPGAVHNDSGTKTRILTADLPAGVSLSDVARAQLIYQVNGPVNDIPDDGTATVKVNGHALGEMPGRRTMRIKDKGINIYAQRSIDVPAGFLSGGTNTVEITVAGMLDIDAIHFELSCNTPLVGAPPSAPGAAGAALAGPLQIDVTWTPGASAFDDYVVERSANGGAFSEVGRTGPGVTGYSDAQIKPSTGYSYRVRAANRAGLSAPGGASGTVTTPAPAGTAPAAPSGLTASAASPQQVDLHWTDNANNEDGYIIEVNTTDGPGSLNADGVWSVTGTTGPNATGFSVPFLNVAVFGGSHSYVFRVKAFNAYGESAYSGVVNGTVPSEPAPGATVNTPTNLTATPASAADIHLAWTDNAVNETAYKVERSQDNVTFDQVALIGFANAQEYLDTNLYPSTKYYYRVQALTELTGSQDPKSAYSNTASATTPSTTTATVPVNPSGLTASLSGPATVSLAWVDNANDQTGFVLQRSVNNGTFKDLAAPKAVDRTYQDGGLQLGTVYAYRIAAVNGKGLSAWSSPATVTTGDPSTGPQPQPSGLLPPTAEKVLSPGLLDGINDALAFAPTDQELTVMDARGRQVYHAQGGAMLWTGKDAAGRPLSAGVYLAKVKDAAGKVRYQRVLIAR